MHKILAALVATFAVTFGALVAVTRPAQAAPVASARALDMDCGDFDTQAAAQRYFIRIGGPRSDPDGLDADGDGIACESNPCPCSTDTGGNGGGGGGGDSNPPPKDPTVRQKAIVVKVVDGDTIRVRLLPGRRVKDVRIIGINTPEIYGGKECGGPAASASAKKIVRPGMRVKLISDRTQDLTDRYGRILRYLHTPRNLDFGRAQITRGLAKVYVYGGKPFIRTQGYRNAQARAKRDDRGNWATCN